MGPEQLRVVIASDIDNVGMRDNLKVGVEREGKFNVVKLSRVLVSRIRQEITGAEPDIVLIYTSLLNQEEINELGGFVRRLHKHVPDAKVIIYGPKIDTSLQEQIGANGWISDATAYELISQELEGFKE
jgi:hypothetical protein